MKVFLVVRFCDPKETIRIRTTLDDAICWLCSCDRTSIVEFKFERID